MIREFTAADSCYLSRSDQEELSAWCEEHGIMPHETAALTFAADGPTLFVRSTPCPGCDTKPVTVAVKRPFPFAAHVVAGLGRRGRPARLSPEM